MSIKPLHNDRQLLAKIAVKDEHAFRTLYNFYNKKVYLLSFRILNSKILSEEVVQETFLKIWLMGTPLINIDNIDSYLNTITRNLSLNILRKLILEKKLNEELEKYNSSSHTETEEQIILNETRRLLQDGISLLPDYQRKVYELCHLQGFKYEEAAQQLNLSTFTVRTYMKLALRFLRSYLRKNSDLIIISIIFRLL